MDAEIILRAMKRNMAANILILFAGCVIITLIIGYRDKFDKIETPVEITEPTTEDEKIQALIDKYSILLYEEIIEIRKKE